MELLRTEIGDPTLQSEITLHQIIVIYVFSSMYVFVLGLCSINQECIPIMTCKDAKEQVLKITATLDPDEKSKLTKTLGLRICGQPSDRSVCCDVDQSKNLNYW